MSSAPSPQTAAHYGVATFDGPVGPLTVFARDGVVVTSGFGSREDVQRMLPAGLGGALWVDASGDADEAALGQIGTAVRAYAAGDVDALDTVPVEQPGGPFLTEAWRVMREIPAGQTWSYAELATKAGRSTAARAAGQACATNRVAPFVPCHRVVRSDGSLGGYAYGLAVKRALLDFEHRHATRSAPADADVAALF